jgi:hypothetical protein
MASNGRSEPAHENEPTGKLTRADHLRLAEEAIARSLVHRKRFFEALERLEKRAR